MRAIDILQEKLESSLNFMHSKRRAALWRLVDGLLQGQQLWLTELGRNLPWARRVRFALVTEHASLADHVQDMAGAVAKDTESSPVEIRYPGTNLPSQCVNVLPASVQSGSQTV